jgi:hypothetical protein
MKIGVQCRGAVWAVCGLCVDCVWAVCGLCVGCVWAVCGQCGLCGLCSLWPPLCVHLCWGHCCLPWLRAGRFPGQGNSLLPEAYSPEAAATHVFRLLSNTSLRHGVGQRARAFAAGVFDLRTHAQHAAGSLR